MTISDHASAPATPAAQDADFETALAVAASADAVFDALTTPAGLSAWWTPASGSGQAGGALTFAFGAGALVAQVDEAARPTTVRWTPVHCDPAPDWVGTTIVFDVLATADGGACLRFRHAGLTPRLECFDMCQAGWTRYLASLAAYLDTGRGWPTSAPADAPAAN